MLKRRGRGLVVHAAVAVVTLTGWGCGGGGGGGGPGGGPPAKPGTVNRAGAMTVISETVGMKDALDSGSGPLLAFNMEIVALTGAQQMVQPIVATRALTAALAIAGKGGGTVDCSASGCVYNNYSDGNFISNGRVGIASGAGGTSATMNLTITQTKGALGLIGISALTYTVTGNLDFTADSIDGTLKAVAHANASFGAVNYTYDLYNEIRYTVLTLVGKTPVGGSIYAKWATTVAGAPSGSQAYEATLTFP